MKLKTFLTSNSQESTGVEAQCQEEWFEAPLSQKIFPGHYPHYLLASKGPADFFAPEIHGSDKFGETNSNLQLYASHLPDH